MGYDYVDLTPAPVPPRQLSESLEQAIRSRIRDYCNSQMHKYGANLGAEIDELQWVLTQAGLEPEKEK